MSRLLLIPLLAMICLGCRTNRTPAVRDSRLGDPIDVTLTRGDFVVVGRQQDGISIFLTIDLREKNCLIEVQNATNAPIDILDCWSGTSIYQRIGYSTSVTVPHGYAQALSPGSVTMLRVFPSQIISGTLPVETQDDGSFKVRLRVWRDDPMLTKWIDVESPVLTVKNASRDREGAVFQPLPHGRGSFKQWVESTSDPHKSPH